MNVRRRRAWHCRFAMLAGAGLLNACAIGPNYQRPQSVAPPTEYFQVPAPQGEKSVADMAWSEMFADPELPPVIRQAIDGNLDLLTAVARIEEFRARHRVARAAFGPEIRAGVQTSPNSLSDEDASYSAGFTLNWELDLFGKLRRSNEAARAQMLASESDARAVMSSLVAAVATTWFQLRELDAELRIIDETIAGQDSSLSLVQSQLRHGVASGAEEQQAIGQLATTRAQRPLALQQRAAAEHLLQFLLGHPPQVLPRTPQTAFTPVPAQIPVGLPAQLLERRPDIVALEQTLHAATAQIGVAEATRFPYLSIGLTSFLGIVSPELAHLVDGKSPSDGLFAWGPVADLPIFQSGAGNARVAAARAQQRQAELAYRSGVLQALREVADALVAIEQTREGIIQNDVRTRAAAEALRLTRLRYRSGVVSYLEVLDGERQLFAAQIDQARSHLAEQQAYVELYRALGGGWSDTDLRNLAPR
jgi:outer membrane protein, multidrug efflux system